MPRVRRAAHAPKRYEQRLRHGLLWLDMLSAFHVRGSWRRSANRLLREAYVLGLVDTLGSAERAAAFASSVFDASETMRLALDEPSPLGIPDAVGSVELEVAHAGSVVGRLAAVDPGGQWAWEDVAKRVVAAVGEDVMRAVVLEELEDEDAPAAAWPRRLAEVVGEG